MEVSEFVRTFGSRGQDLMWLLGAGASVSAGIPSANDLIWQFKRAIYCSERKLAMSSCQDVGNPVLQARLQEFFDAQGTYPTANADDEYARFFQMAYPSAEDRRRMIDAYVRGASPSYGSLVLGILAAMGRIKLIWTTNFDHLIEDAFATAYKGTSNWVAGGSAHAVSLCQAALEQRWPILCKLHGDFQTVELKNTTEELRIQDSRLRDLLMSSARQHGLIVVGYSGRDASIMDALTKAAESKPAFPFGVYWCYPSGTPISESVADFINFLRSHGVDTHTIEIDSFDDLLTQVYLHTSDVPPALHEIVESLPRRVSDAPHHSPGKGHPLLRFNALTITELPPVCRLVQCSVGGAREVKEAVNLFGQKIIAARKKVGVIAFGSDQDVRDALSAYGDPTFDVFDLNPYRLQYESVEHGLLLEAVAKAIARVRGLIAYRSHRSWLLKFQEGQEEDKRFASLHTVSSRLVGGIKGTGMTWSEALELKLQYRFETPLLVLLPTIAVDGITDVESRYQANRFRMDRLARRYNNVWNKTLDAWVKIVTAGDEEAVLSTFGLTDGIDAIFRVARRTAYSRGV
ncbi:MAG: SIR2 family protein [Candidatus Zixiibacteriota bacterium]